MRSASFLEADGVAATPYSTCATRSGATPTIYAMKPHSTSPCGRAVVSLKRVAQILAVRAHARIRPRRWGRSKNPFVSASLMRSQ
jgi:hypothetical protein